MKKIIISIFLLWGILFALGYPFPYGDDLWYLGSTLSLAKTGVFTNPFAEGWNAVKSAETEFYVASPFTFYILSAWLKIVGISAYKLTFFYSLCYFIFSILTAYLMKAYRFSTASIMLVIVSFAVWQCLHLAGPWFGYGLRHEPLALVFAVLGACCLLKDSFLRLLAGFFLLSASIATLPILIAFVPFLSAAILLSRHGFNLSRFGKYVFAALPGFAVTVFLFGLAIHFDWQIFIKDFSLYLTLRRPPEGQILQMLKDYLMSGAEPIIRLPKFIAFGILCALSGFLAFKSGNQKRVIGVVCLAGAVSANLVLYVAAISFTKWAVEVGIILLLDKILCGRAAKKGMLLIAGIIFLPGLFQASSVVLLADHSKPDVKSIQEYIRMNPGKKYVVDSAAARWVFDYDFPEGVHFVDFTDPIKPRKSIREKKADEVWIVSKADLMVFLPDAGVTAPGIEIFGRVFRSLPKKPFELIMISGQGAGDRVESL